MLSPTTGQAHPLWSTEAGVGVERGGGGWHLRTAEGAVTELGLDPAALPVHLDRIEGGWLVSAVSTADSGSADAAGRVMQRIHLVSARPAVDGGPASAEALPVPATAGFVVSPTPLVDTRGRLLELLFFEGPAPHSTALYAARWEDGGWSAPEVISGRGPGTQTALATARLADGTHIAAWAAYDGEDDEILWSHRGADGRWSAPRPVTDNAVPDVTPTLYASAASPTSPAGVLLAWSGFDGRDYRVFTARLVPGSQDPSAAWSSRTVLGGPGSVAPYFARDAEALLVFQQTVPRRWLVWQLSAAGDPVRSAATESHLTERPVVLEAGEEKALLAWPALARAPVSSPAARATKGGSTAPELGRESLDWLETDPASP
ncbi:MAG: hypothetical protein MI919_42685 [Holophagales bacterium]|nr:hypothetical protein [Holophagales bacterium]